MKPNDDFKYGDCDDATDLGNTAGHGVDALFQEVGVSQVRGYIGHSPPTT